jgi:hypothetical protein
MIAPGKYRAKASCWGIAETKAGNEQFQIEFEILEEKDSNGKQIGPSDHVMNWFGSFSSDKSTEITVKALRNGGWTGDDLTSVELPNDVELVVEHESQTDASGNPVLDKQGVPAIRARIRWVNRIGGSGIKSIDAARARRFADRMKGMIARLDGRPVPANTTSPVEFGATGTDDDLPF